MTQTRLVLFFFVLLAATVLALAGKISGEAWIALVGGALLPSPLDRKPGSSALYLALPLCLAAACGGGRGLEMGIRYTADSPGAAAAIASPIAIGAASKSAPIAQGTLLTDGIEMKPRASLTCTSGRACLFAKSGDNLWYTTDAAGLELKLHAAQSFRTSASCSGLSSPTAGDVCYDTTATAFKYYDGTWESIAEDDLVVHLAGTETITGAKTFSAAPVFAAGLTASGSSANNFSGSSGTFLTSTGAVTVGPGAVGISGLATLAPPVQTSGSPALWTVTGPAHTTLAAGTEASDYVVNLARTVQFATGALATQRAARFMAPTYAFAGASTLTNAATLAVSGPPVAGTNATLTNTWALWIQSGYLNAAGNIVTPSIGTSTAAQHALPTGTGDVVSTDATQTLTNKTLTNPTLSGTLIAGANTLIGAVANKLNAAYLAIASQAIGDLLYADSTSTFARLADVATGSVLASGGVGTAPAWAANGTLTGLYAAHFLGHASGALTGGATKYLQTGDASGEAAAQRELFLSVVPTVTLQVLVFGCTVTTEPGGGESVVFTVQKSTDRGATWSDTTATCTISGTANECADSTNHPTLAQYDLFAVKLVNSNNGIFAAAGARCSAMVAK